MTREKLLARIDDHEAFACTEDAFIKQQAADEEDDGGWVAVGTMPKAPGKRHDQRGLREAMRNEAEVRVARITEACQLARQEIDNGDGDRALFYEHQAAQERTIVEPIMADLKQRADRKVDGAKGGANSWKGKPRTK
jgi:hypothetical protein